MATTVKEAVNYPMISTSAWWKLRKQFNQSMPTRVSANSLASLFNMTSKSASVNLLSPLKKMGLVDEQGNTTERAKRWRDDDQYPLVCEEIRRAIYPQELLESFPSPDSPRASIEKWFAMDAGVGDSAKGKMTTLYLLLAEADPTKQESASSPAKTLTSGKTSPSSIKSNNSAAKKATTEKSNGTAHTPLSQEPMQNIQPQPQQNGNSITPTLHIDIQIHIPTDASPEQIDRIFSSMAKHLYKGNSVNE